MAIQNTHHVMNCELGQWYSDDKTSAFQVLEKNEKVTSIKITFAKEELDDYGESIKEKEEVCTCKEKCECNKKDPAKENKCYCEDKCECVETTILKQDTCTQFKAEDGVKLIPINEKNNGNREVNIKLLEPLTEDSKDLENKLKNYTAPSLGDTKTNDSEKLSHDTDEYIIKQNIAGDNMKEDGKLVAFIRENVALFIALSMFNFFMAVMITLFCFIFPNALGNVKGALEQTRDWVKSKIDTGINLGLGLPKLGSDVVSSGGIKLASPFKWIWRFLNCAGKCFGLSMPSKSTPSVSKPVSKFSIPMPSYSIQMPKFLSCMINCPKRK